MDKEYAGKPMDFMAEGANVDEAIDQMDSHFAGDVSSIFGTASDSSVIISGLEQGVYFGRLAKEAT